MCVNVTETVCFDCNVNGQFLDCDGQWGSFHVKLMGFISCEGDNVLDVYSGKVN